MANLTELDVEYIDKLGDYFPSVGFRWEQDSKEFIIVKAAFGSANAVLNIGTAVTSSVTNNVVSYSGGADGMAVIFDPQTFEAVVASTGNITGRADFNVGITATTVGSVPLKQISSGDCFAVQIRGIATVASVGVSSAGARLGFSGTAGQLVTATNVTGIDLLKAVTTAGESEDVKLRNPYVG